LRTTVPVSLDGPVGTVRDTVFAALADLALNQLARDISKSTSQGPGNLITAYMLLEDLKTDISDGLFDGRHNNSPITTQGGAYSLSSATTRIVLARSLVNFLESTANRTGLSRDSLAASEALNNISNDLSILYPPDERPSEFDDIPPQLE